MLPGALRTGRAFQSDLKRALTFATAVHRRSSALQLPDATLEMAGSMDAKMVLVGMMQQAQSPTRWRERCVRGFLGEPMQPKKPSPFMATAFAKKLSASPPTTSSPASPPTSVGTSEKLSPIASPPASKKTSPGVSHWNIVGDTIRMSATALLLHEAKAELKASRKTPAPPPSPVTVELPPAFRSAPLPSLPKRRRPSSPREDGWHDHPTAIRKQNALYTPPRPQRLEALFDSCATSPLKSAILPTRRDGAIVQTQQRSLAGTTAPFHGKRPMKTAMDAFVHADLLSELSDPNKSLTYAQVRSRLAASAA